MYADAKVLNYSIEIYYHAMPFFFFLYYYFFFLFHAKLLIL